MTFTLGSDQGVSRSMGKVGIDTEAVKPQRAWPVMLRISQPYSMFPLSPLILTIKALNYTECDLQRLVFMIIAIITSRL